MKAVEAAKKVIEKLGTRDCFAIAEKFSLKIIYQNWHPVTIGEFDKKSKTICINLNALVTYGISEESIVAHELGHFFAAEFDSDRTTEETFAKEFAAELIRKK